MRDRPIKALHGLRGIAAISVVVGHAAPIAFDPALGVLLFFLLSGFLIGRLYLDVSFDRTSVLAYARARLARIYPLFALVILVTAAINTLTGAQVFRLTPADIPAHLLLAGDNKTVWTISVECQFYALFILFWWANSRKLLPDALLFMLTAAAFIAASGVEGRIFLLRYLFLFLLGMSIARLTDRNVARAAIAAPLLLVCGLLYIWAGLRTPPDTYSDFPAIIACAGLLWCAVAAPASIGARLLSLPLLVWLGEISFGTYLLHRHAQRGAHLIVGEEGTWPYFALVLVITLIAAHLAYRLWEDPARRLLRGRATNESA